MAISFVILFSIKIACIGQSADSGTVLQVRGAVTHPLDIKMTDFAAFQRVVVHAVDHDGKDHEFSGVPVGVILQQAGATLGGQLRGKNMAKYLLVQARDGYQTVFALAELDSSFTDRIILLADREDGNPIPSDKGPYRIIVPGEKKHARWTWGVTALIIKTAEQ